MFSTIIVNYPQQIFNDALDAYEKAIQLNKLQKPFTYWKYCTWSIVASAMAMESYVTDYLRSLETEFNASDWESYDRESRRLSLGAKGIFAKLRLVELISNSQIVDDTDPDWINIKNTIHLRNDLVHYRKQAIFNVINDTNAKQSIEACRSLIKKFLNALDIDYTTTILWIDKTTSEEYDK